MTGLYLKENKGTQGEISSLKRILEKYIENSPLWQFFFHFQKQFCTFPSEWKVCSVEREQKEGREAVFYASLKRKKDVMKTNWQAVTIYLSCCRSALT